MALTFEIEHRKNQEIKNSSHINVNPMFPIGSFPKYRWKSNFRLLIPPIFNIRREKSCNWRARCLRLLVNCAKITSVHFLTSEFFSSKSSKLTVECDWNCNVSYKRKLCFLEKKTTKKSETWVVARWNNKRLAPESLEDWPWRV